MKVKLYLVAAMAVTCILTGALTGAPLTGLLAATMVAAGALPTTGLIGARSGVVTVDDDVPGLDAVMSAVAQSDPLVTTLGSLVVSANRARADETIGLVQVTNDLSERRAIFADPNILDPAQTLTNLAPLVKSAELTFDGAEVSGPMTNAVANGTGLSTAVNAALAATKPSYTAASIISKLEDIILATEGVTDGMIVVDQTNAKIYLYTGTPANVVAQYDEVVGTLAGNALAAFEQDATPSSAADRQFGE